MTAAGQGVAPELSARVCLDLGHAYAEHAAKRAGVRLLHIKGLAADRVLPIDDARVSDVDVLLDPEGLTRFTRVLLEREDCLLVDDASRSTEAHAVAVGAPLVVAYDFGSKWNILRRLTSYGCRVVVVPADTPADEVLALAPAGIFLSNGPGDPAAVTYAAAAVRRFLTTDIPLFGICLGHQILGLALGGRTYKLKFGHHGGNQPVKDLVSGRVQITSQNHNYAVAPDSLPPEVEVTHWNLNDGTVEGLRLKDRPVFSVQYHPEASPGPHDADELFARFVTALAH